MFLSELISLKDALYKINQNQKVLDTETIFLKNAQGRVLAKSVTSYHDIPPFDKSTRDGYALIAEDTLVDSKLKIIDRIGAGDFSDKSISHGEAIVIATGAPIPKGANAVLMKEFTEETGDYVEIHSSIGPNKNIAPKAGDIAYGDLILAPNTLIRPQEMSLIASAGYNEIEVFKKPRVKLIITGNELVEPCKELDEAKIINSNQFVISGMVKSAGAICDIEHTHDDFDEIKLAIEKSSKEYDLIITTGGTAISNGDLIFDVVQELGEVLFHGVDIRPGKLAGAGIINGTGIFMLSGQPAAAMVQFDFFVRPYLFNMQGLNYKSSIVQKMSKTQIKSRLGRVDIIKAYCDDEDIQILKRGSGVIRSMVKANSYVLIGEDYDGIREGDSVDIMFFRDMVWPII